MGWFFILSEIDMGKQQNFQKYSDPVKHTVLKSQIFPKTFEQKDNFDI